MEVLRNEVFKCLFVNFFLILLIKLGVGYVNNFIIFMSYFVIGFLNDI